MRHLSRMMAPWFEAAGLCVRGGGFQKPCSLRSVIAGEGSPASDPLGDAAWSHPSHPSRYQGLLSRECWGQDGAGAWESSSFPPAASAVLLWAPHVACASLYLIDKRKPHASRSLVNSRVVIRGGVWGGWQPCCLISVEIGCGAESDGPDSRSFRGTFGRRHCWGAVDAAWARSAVFQPQVLGHSALHEHGLLLEGSAWR